MEVFYVYLLKCWKNNDSMKRERPVNGHIIYTGQTNNIFRRLIEHITGKSFYTRQFNGNICLGCLEAYETRQEAINREAEIKKYSRDQKVYMMYDFQEKHKDKIDFIMKEVNKRVKKANAVLYRKTKRNIKI